METYELNPCKNCSGEAWGYQETIILSGKRTKSYQIHCCDCENKVVEKNMASAFKVWNEQNPKTVE